MCKKTLFLITALLILLVPAVSLASAESIGSNELIDRAKDYDGTTVVYEGEVVGDVLYRGDFAWLAVFDGSNTIGCYVSKEEAEQILVCGGYGKRGDTVRIEGVFHRACTEHGGDLDIHATASFAILRAGSAVQMPLSRLVTVLAIALPLPAAGLLFLVWKRRAATSLIERKTLTNPAQK